MVKNLSRGLGIAITTSILFTTTSFAETGTPSVTTTTPETSPKTKPLQEARNGIKNTMKQQAVDYQVETKEQAVARKEAFKAKLLEIKDMGKKSSVERINTKLATINQRRTTQMEQGILTLKTRLTLLEGKTATAKLSGKDTALVEDSIAEAKANIQAAETALAAQKEKDYTLTITSEEQLRITVGQSIKTAQTDLRLTHGLVVAAKKSVMTVAKEVAILQGQTNTTEPNVTGSAN